MIMNEKLLTHRPTHRVAFRERGINSVMGLKKTRRTQTDRHYVAFTTPSHRRPLPLWKSLWMFVCFVSQLRDRRCGSEWKERRGAELSVFPVTTKRSFLCHTASDQQPLPVHQTAPPGSISKMFQPPSLVSFRKAAAAGGQKTKVQFVTRPGSALTSRAGSNVKTGSFSLLRFKYRRINADVRRSLRLSASLKLIINSQTESRTIINHNFILFIAEI